MNDSNFARSRTLFLLPFSAFRRSALFGVVAMALTLSACGSDTAQESLIEALADVDGLEVQIDDDTVSYRYESEDELVVMGPGTTLPSAFPDDVLIYEDAEIIGSFETAEELSVRLSAPDSAEVVMRTYEQSLQATGWEATESMLMGPMAITKFEKESRVVMVSAMSVDGENSVITLTTGTG